MLIQWRDLGDKLRVVARQCADEAILVAPFIKEATLRDLIKEIPESVTLRCLTRWRLEELASGVSDLGVWNLISSRSQGTLHLLQNLHAKYYRFDKVGFIGSANITKSALGWGARPNFEVQVLSSFATDESAALERDLFCNSIQVTDAIATSYAQQLNKYLEESLAAVPPKLEDLLECNMRITIDESQWVPKFRVPDVLFDIYRGEFDGVSRAALIDALDDLMFLDLPPSVAAKSFRALVGSRLTAMPLVMQIDDFCSTARRFGEMREFLRERLQCEDATAHWQTLMRWMLYFLPEKYSQFTANYTEVFVRQR